MTAEIVNFLRPPELSSYEAKQKARLVHFMLSAWFIGALVAFGLAI